MTTGHVLPGYGPIVGNIAQFRSKSAGPTMSSYRFRGGFNLREPALDFSNPHLMAQIRHEAKAAWTDDMKDWMDTPEKRPTTYAHSFYRKGPLESEDPVILRPTSPTRRNKPHPKEVFMKCNLQRVPGYHDPYKAMGQEMNVVEGFQNPDATIREDVYLVDGMCSREEQNSRQHLRHKYTARPSTSATNRYHDSQREKLRRVMNDPWSAQAAEAWMKLADEKGRTAAQKVIQHANYQHHLQKSKSAHTMRSPREVRSPRDVRSPREVKVEGNTPFHASLHRFLKAAGNEEAQAFESLLKSTKQRKVLPMSGPHFHITDYSKPIKVHPKHTRTDFIYHPEMYP